MVTCSDWEERAQYYELKSCEQEQEIARLRKTNAELLAALKAHHMRATNASIAYPIGLLCTDTLNAIAAAEKEDSK